MKLLTLNTHSLEEPDYAKKTEKFIEMLEKEQPDIIALQEVIRQFGKMRFRISCWMVISAAELLTVR